MDEYYILKCSDCKAKNNFTKDDKTIQCVSCDCVYEVNISKDDEKALRKRDEVNNKQSKEVNNEKEKEAEDEDTKSNESEDSNSNSNELDSNKDNNEDDNSDKGKDDKKENDNNFKDIFESFMTDDDKEKQSEVNFPDISDISVNKVRDEKEKQKKALGLNDLQSIIEDPRIQQLLFDALQERQKKDDNNNNNNNKKEINDNIKHNKKYENDSDDLTRIPKKFVQKVKKLKKKADKYEEAIENCNIDLDISDITSNEEQSNNNNNNSLYYSPPINSRLKLTEDIKPERIKEVLDNFSESFPGLLANNNQYKKKSEYSTILTTLKRVLISSNNNRLINAIKKDGIQKSCKISCANLEGKKCGNVNGLAGMVVLQHGLQQISLMNIKQPNAMLLALLELIYVLYSILSLMTECNEFLLGTAVKKFINLNAKPGINYIKKFRDIKRDFEAAIVKFDDNPNKYLTIGRFCLTKIRTGWCNNKACKLIHFCIECNTNNCEHFRKTGNAFFNQNKYYDMLNKNKNYYNGNSNWRGRGRGNWRGRGNYNRYNNYSNNNNNGYNNNNFQPSDQFTPPSNNNNNRRGGSQNSGRGRGH